MMITWQGISCGYYDDIEELSCDEDGMAYGTTMELRLSQALNAMGQA